jgi:ribonuclease HII
VTDLMTDADEQPSRRTRFASNKGYPSPHHQHALADVGPCELHRHSWAPIAALNQQRLFD